MKNIVAQELARKSVALGTAAMMVAGLVPATAFAAVGEQSAFVTLSDQGEESDYDRAALKDGTYDMQVSLNQSASPDVQSMAGASVSGNAQLVVKDGAYSVVVTLLTMNVMGVYGDITQMYYYPGGYVQNGTAYFQGSATKCDVLTNRVADHDGVTYPETVSIPVVKTAIQDGYVLVALTTTGMSDGAGGPAIVNAVLKLDWQTFDKQYGPQEEVVDKTALTSELQAAAALSQGSSQTVDWNLLQNAVSDAKKANANEEATQLEVDTQVSNLRLAINRFNGSDVPACESGYFYVTPIKWVQESGQESAAGNFFGSTAEVRAAADGGYTVRISVNQTSGANITALTYGTSGIAATVVNNTSDEGSTQYELAVSALNAAISVNYTLLYNGSPISQQGYLVLDYTQASKVKDTTTPTDPEDPSKEDVFALEEGSTYGTQVCFMKAGTSEPSMANNFFSGVAYVSQQKNEYQVDLLLTHYADMVTGFQYDGADVAYTDNADGTRTYHVKMSGLAGAFSAKVTMPGGVQTLDVQLDTSTLPTVKERGTAPVISRLWGATRYETMQKIAEEGFTQSDVAILAKGGDFPDALASSALAGAYNAPIILTDTASLSDEAKAELTRLGVKTVYVLGGSASVSDEAVAEVKKLCDTVERVSGGTRQETSQKIYERVVGQNTSCDTVIVASGASFADALSVSPYAYAKRTPILLTNNDGTLTAEEVSAIKANAHIKNIVLVGGTASVSSSVEDQFKGDTDRTYNVSRLSGSGRYETSAQIAEWELGQGLSSSAVSIATGATFPDALAGAALSGSKNSILLLAADGNTDQATSVLSAHQSNIETIYVFGGTSTVNETVKANCVAAVVKKEGTASASLAVLANAEANDVQESATASVATLANASAGFEEGHTYQVPISWLKHDGTDESMAAKYFGETALIRPQSDGTLKVNFSATDDGATHILGLAYNGTQLAQENNQYEMTIPASNSEVVLAIDMTIKEMQELGAGTQMADLHLKLAQATDLGTGKEEETASKENTKANTESSESSDSKSISNANSGNTSNNTTNSSVVSGKVTKASSQSSSLPKTGETAVAGSVAGAGALAAAVAAFAMHKRRESAEGGQSND